MSKIYRQGVARIKVFSYISTYDSKSMKKWEIWKSFYIISSDVILTFFIIFWVCSLRCWADEKAVWRHVCNLYSCFGERGGDRCLYCEKIIRVFRQFKMIIQLDVSTPNSFIQLLIDRPDINTTLAYISTKFIIC